MEGEAINRLLVVDDEAAQVQALCHTLEDEGYSVKGFTGAGAALGALRSGTFDIVLTDLTMPGMDGIAFLNAAREIDPGLAGIVMTGHGTIATAVEAMKAGALDYILKPFDLRVILRVLARTQAMLRLRRENAALLERLSLRTVELETANRELEVANRELEAFSDSVSHDLRAPLRTIDGLLRVVQEDFAAGIPPEACRHLEAVSGQASRMSELIEDLLRLSRLRREPLQKQPVDVLDLVRQVAGELRAAEATRDVEIRIGELPPAQADPSLLRQVWVNLVANALKFTRRRERALIEIAGEGRAANKLYSIRDNGAGFDPRRAERLFGIFQRLHAAKDFEGTGVGLSIARRWFDQEKVDAIFGLGNSAVALAVQQLCHQRQKIDVVIAAGTTDLTGKECSPYGLAWTYDNYSAAKAPADALVKQGKGKWYFIVSDYAFGHSLEDNASAILRGLGGKVLGHALVPLGTTDYSAALTQAAATHADVVGICCGGADFINCAKQMGEFGLIRSGITPAALNCSLTNIHSLGLPVAQGMLFSQPYYWDRDEPSRAFAARFAKRMGRPPTAFQASTWGAVTHYLKGVRAAGTDAGPAVMDKMRAIPINDFMTKDGSIRIDGRVIRDELLLRAKTPAQSHGEWDLLDVVEVIPGKDAFRPLDEGGCPLAS